MHAFLRRLLEWKGRRQGAQFIIFDGAADFEKTTSFAKGAVTGVGLCAVAFALTAPTSMSPAVADELSRREDLLRESNQRAEQAMRVADVCVSTAQNLERTLSAYQAALGGRPPALALADPNPRRAREPLARSDAEVIADELAPPLPIEPAAVSGFAEPWLPDSGEPILPEIIAPAPPSPR